MSMIDLDRIALKAINTVKSCPVVVGEQVRCISDRQVLIVTSAVFDDTYHEFFIDAIHTPSGKHYGLLLGEVEFVNIW